MRYCLALACPGVSADVYGVSNDRNVHGQRRTPTNDEHLLAFNLLWGQVDRDDRACGLVAVAHMGFGTCVHNRPRLSTVSGQMGNHERALCATVHSCPSRLLSVLLSVKSCQGRSAAHRALALSPELTSNPASALRTAHLHSAVSHGLVLLRSRGSRFLPSLVGGGPRSGVDW